MRRRSPAVHPLHCACRLCAPGRPSARGMGFAVLAATRALVLLAAIVAIPFIVAHLWAGSKGDPR